MKIIQRDQADRVIAGEIAQIRQVGRRGQQQPVDLELLHGVANSLLSNSEISLGACDGSLHVVPVVQNAREKSLGQYPRFAAIVNGWRECVVDWANVERA